VIISDITHVSIILLTLSFYSPDGATVLSGSCISNIYHSDTVAASRNLIVLAMKITITGLYFVFFFQPN